MQTSRCACEYVRVHLLGMTSPSALYAQFFMCWIVEILYFACNLSHYPKPLQSFVETDADVCVPSCCCCCCCCCIPLHMCAQTYWPYAQAYWHTHCIQTKLLTHTHTHIHIYIYSDASIFCAAIGICLCHIACCAVAVVVAVVFVVGSAVAAQHLQSVWYTAHKLNAQLHYIHFTYDVGCVHLTWYAFILVACKLTTTTNTTSITVVCSKNACRQLPFRFGTAEAICRRRQLFTLHISNK